MIFSWWQPLPSDYEAYAEAGFNIALLRGDTWVNKAQTAAYREGHGKEWHATHDGLFEAVLEESNQLAEHGVMSVFSQVNLAPDQKPRDTQAYGNRTGGVIQGNTNLTTKSFQSSKNGFDTGDVRSYMSTIPEIKYLISELEKRNMSKHFAGVFLHDDTVTQVSYVVKMAEYLQEHAPWLIPIVNQVSGNSAPETLYRSKLFISSPEQYPISGCSNGECQPGVPITQDCLKSGDCINATSGASAQQSANEANAFVDMRFGLDHWPLFNLGGGNGPLNWTNGTGRVIDPDTGRRNVRSDSLVRWMAYSAIAFGAKALNYYCWSSAYYMQTCGCPGVQPPDVQQSGLQTCGCNTSLPGRPSPIYNTVKEINADASKWGDILIGGDFRYAVSYNSAGSWNADGQLVGPLGDSTPSAATLVTAMSDKLVVTSFLTRAAGPVAYLFVVSKEVSPYLPMVAARNITLTLHPSVESASVVLPGMQGRTGFDLGAGTPKRSGRVRPHFAEVGRADGAVTVTVQVVGGGGALIKVTGDGAAMQDAAYGKVQAFFDPAAISLAPDRSGGSKLKAPSWAYGTFAFGANQGGGTGYMPLNDMELASGQSFEEGEQTAFIIGGSLTAPLAGPVEAKEWAWAGYNVLSMPAPSLADTAAYGSQSQAFGDLLDWGFNFGYFGVLEAPAGEVLSDAAVVGSVDNFRCHGRMGGLVLANNHSNSKAVAAAAKTLRTVARGPWLLPFASAASAADAVALGAVGVPLAMPSVNVVSGSAIAAATAIATDYAVLYEELGSHWRSHLNPGNNRTEYKNHGNMVFVASLDACSYESDSLLRFQAFSALAFGARGIYWRGARECAGLGTDKWALLKSINTRIKGWGDIFVPSATPYPGPFGYNISRLTTGEGWPMPSCVTKPTATSLVESMDENVLVAELGSQGRYATRLIYVMNRAVSLQRGGAPVRDIRVRLRGVAANQPLEGDCAAGACQCGAGIVGPDIVLQLPGGSGQLVALSMLNTTLLHPTNANIPPAHT
jgi:hypothetical protein